MPASHVSLQVLHNPHRRRLFRVHVIQHEGSFSLCFMHYYTVYMLHAHCVDYQGKGQQSTLKRLINSTPSLFQANRRS